LPYSGRQSYRFLVPFFDALEESENLDVVSGFLERDVELGLEVDEALFSVGSG